MELDDTIRTYRRYAGFYDVVFGAIFAPGRKAAVALLNDRPNQRILEVGVGTGLSLPMFRRDTRVTGIDVSAEMLDKARDKVAELKLDNVEAIREMDAERLDFPDDSFDAVLALYVVSVVSDPKKFGDEVRRVCKNGGRIVIVNHFARESGAMRVVEQTLAPFAGKIGFHSDFRLEPFLAASGFRVVERRPANLFGYWTLLVCRNDK